MNMVGLWEINWTSTQEMSDMSIFVSNAKLQLKKKVTILNIKCNSDAHYFMGMCLWLKNIPPKSENSRRKI
jgi:hypothetical protein